VTPLQGRVVLVAGATRGAGRGIAVGLGEAGATVYCSGRSTRERRSEYDRPETIEETAELVTEAGGTGIAASRATTRCRCCCGARAACSWR
jgi:NAD(P)-dependent dehydrogenase (short-subunit alcohol dehydrogenase family)